MKRSILKTSVPVILLGLLLSLAVSCALAETRTIIYYDYDGNKIEGFDDSYYSFTVSWNYLDLPDAQDYPALLPERDGKIFVGWRMEKDLSGRFYDNLYCEQNEDITLYAYYWDYYTVTWYSADGTTVLTADDMEIPYDYFDKYTSVKEYKCPTLIAPDGKTFVGWSTTPNDLKNTMNFISKGTKGDLKLYAVYGSTYSITYYDGDTKIEGFDDWYSSYTEGEYISLPDAGEYPELLPERDGQIFAGWCMNKDLSGEILIGSYDYQDIDWSGDLTFYACYADYYTVTWYSWDGETVLTADDMAAPEYYFDKYTSVRDYWGPDVEVPEPEWTKKEFIGWSTTPNDSKNAAFYIRKGTTGNLKLYATLGNIYSITYYIGDEKIEYFDYERYSYTEGSFCYLPSAEDYPEFLSERDGQIFVGWCMEKDLSGDILEEYYEKAGWSGDLTLYACYVKPYDITWYSSDGETVLTADDMTYSEAYIDQYTSVKDYYCPTPKAPKGSVFIGWYRSSSFSGRPITMLEKGTWGDLKLYARFISIENLSVTPSTWVLNSDASAAGGKLTVRVTGVDPSVIAVTHSEAMTVVENTEKNEYYIWTEDKEMESDFVTVRVGYTALSEISLTFRDMPDILTLPAAMQTIKAEAFMNCTNIDGVSVRGNKLTEIQSGAFRNCTGLYFIELPDSVTTIADNAFEGCANVQFYCSDNSKAAAYAEAHGIPHSPLYQE